MCFSFMLPTFSCLSLSLSLFYILLHPVSYAVTKEEKEENAKSLELHTPYPLTRPPTHTSTHTHKRRREI